jgi:Icc-related predicted phosphoesterase
VKNLLTTIFFATDVHGSDICWAKFINAGKFYGADVIVLGGDMTGKAVVPIIDQGAGAYKAVLLQQEFFLQGEEEVTQMIKKIKSRGYYPYKTTPEEISELNQNPERVHQIFVQEVLKTAEQWLANADQKLENTNLRCFVCPGNDDMFELDDLIRSAKHVHLGEGQVVELDKQHEMLCSGYSNPTPWHTYREEPDEELRKRYQPMLAQLKNPRSSVFCLHAPPFGSTLDDAPELTADLRPKYAGNALIPVGSKAVRDIIQEYQPLLGLHGHIHEAKGSTRLGRTLCINPGSMYEQGTLLGALVKLDRDKIKSYVLTTG